MVPFNKFYLIDILYFGEASFSCFPLVVHVSFNCMSIFKIVDLKFLSSKPNVWHSSGSVFIVFEWVIISYFFGYFVFFVVVVKQTFRIL